MITEMNTSRPHRLRLAFVQAKSQLRYSLLIPAFGFLASILLAFSGWVAVDNIFRALNAGYIPEPELLSGAEQTLHLIFSLIIFSSVLVAIISIAVGMVWSYRVFGPVVPFKNHIENLKQGRFESRVRLRQYDEFKDLEIALNELAERWQKNPPTT